MNLEGTKNRDIKKRHTEEGKDCQVQQLLIILIIIINDDDYKVFVRTLKERGNEKDRNKESKKVRVGEIGR